MTSPNGLAQQSVIRTALNQTGQQPRHMAALDAHGTGTFLGDPIEVAALGAAFAAGRGLASQLTIGAVKTTVGHLEAAAGLVALGKTFIRLNSCAQTPNLHFCVLN